MRRILRRRSRFSEDGLIGHSQEGLLQAVGLALEIRNPRVDFNKAASMSHELEYIRGADSAASAEVAARTLESVRGTLQSA